MRIFLAGPNWHGGITENLARAFGTLGCTVYPFYFSTFSNQPSGKALEVVNQIPYLPYLSPYIHGVRQILTTKVEEVVAEKTNQRLIQEALEFSPDVIFLIACNANTVSASRVKKELSVPLIAWFVDDPSLRWMNNPPFFNYQSTKNILYYDTIFVWDSFLCSSLGPVAESPIYYLPHAADPDVFKPLTLSEEEYQPYECEIGFVGSAYYGLDGSGVVRARILEALNRFRLKIWGDPGWNILIEKDFPQLKPFFQKKTLSLKALNQLYNAADIVLNIHHPQCLYGTNMRTFEIGASGGFQLVEYRKEIPDLLKIDEKEICFHNAEELETLVWHYLKRPDDRRAIAARIRKTVLGEHTYLHRARFILEKIGDIKPRLADACRLCPR